MASSPEFVPSHPREDAISCPFCKIHPLQASRRVFRQDFFHCNACGALVIRPLNAPHVHAGVGADPDPAPVI